MRNSAKVFEVCSWRQVFVVDTKLKERVGENTMLNMEAVIDSIWKANATHLQKNKTFANKNVFWKPVQFKHFFLRTFVSLSHTVFIASHVSIWGYRIARSMVRFYSVRFHSFLSHRLVVFCTFQSAWHERISFRYIFFLSRHAGQAIFYSKASLCFLRTTRWVHQSRLWESMKIFKHRKHNQKKLWTHSQIFTFFRVAK